MAEHEALGCDVRPGKALVTGASCGVGRAGARKLADDGFHVPVHGRAAQGSQIAEVIAPLASPASSSFTEALIPRRRRTPPSTPGCLTARGRQESNAASTRALATAREALTTPGSLSIQEEMPAPS
ncbi:MAG: hypothetical protein QOE61_5531 [Micromonosporaceae bacterium]|nr:hypothetical protein [Micromonosporaceae bacterium]